MGKTHALIELANDIHNFENMIIYPNTKSALERVLTCV